MSIPAHHAGTALDVAASMDAIRSDLLPTQVANITPSINPNRAVIIVEVVTNMTDLGNRSSIKEPTLLLPSAVFKVLASPRSSLATLVIIDGSLKYHCWFSP